MELTPLPSPCLHLGASSSPGPRLASLGLEELDLYIRYQVADRIATITLDRPEAANAQNGELLDQLDAAWVRAAQDEDVAVIVLRAEGKHFSSGHDLKDKSWPDPSKITLDRIYGLESRRYLEYSLRWHNVPKPSIAAVQGRCIAGGLLLCWPCDLIVAAAAQRYRATPRAGPASRVRPEQRRDPAPWPPPWSCAASR